jgi:hypothetical protein
MFAFLYHPIHSALILPFSQIVNSKRVIWIYAVPLLFAVNKHTPSKACTKEGNRVDLRGQLPVQDFNSTGTKKMQA